jgi:hypothetical protein|uniref:Uncharacterized protein n=1 Tax=Podoviridae sp. ctEmK1 TaxID=2827727 RepID=A0A8S5S5Q1_9CAUD|nr:MAG TPA: hypothetical protein [Podoviridae sp. ctEmK1]
MKKLPYILFYIFAVLVVIHIFIQSIALDYIILF